MLRSVAALVLDRVAVFEFGVICEVFGIDRARDGVPNFDFRVCGVEPGVPLRTTVGASLIPDHGLEGLADADLVALPAGHRYRGGAQRFWHRDLVAPSLPARCGHHAHRLPQGLCGGRALAALAGQREPAVRRLFHQPVDQKRIQRPITLRDIGEPRHVELGPRHRNAAAAQNIQ